MRSDVPQACPVAISDPAPAADAPRNLLERLAVGGLRDPRDLAFVRLALRAACILPPFILVLYLGPPWLAALLALPYLAVLYGAFGGPLLLMLHAVSHRPTFRRSARWLDRGLRVALPLLYGMSPAAYRAHHLLMHHADENREADVSSTLGHVRDEPAEFARYLLRFLVASHVHLVGHVRARRRRRETRRLLLEEALLHASLIALLVVAPVPTLVAGVAPYLLTRFFLMAGNWAQHAFVDPEHPDDAVRNSTVLVNASQNHRCFNDGYHAVHHRHPSMHWAQMSRSFQAEWPSYAARGVIVFDGIANQQVVWARLMRKDYAYLADRMLDTGFVPATRAGRIAFLQARTRARIVPRKGLFERRENAVLRAARTAARAAAPAIR